jgi:hypothetical protein
MEGAGDIDVAKKLAQNDLKKRWGVSSVTKSDTLMRLPPDKAPAYMGVPDAASAHCERKP